MQNYDLSFQLTDSTVIHSLFKDIYDYLEDSNLRQIESHTERDAAIEAVLRAINLLVANIPINSSQLSKLVHITEHFFGEYKVKTLNSDDRSPISPVYSGILQSCFRLGANITVKSPNMFHDLKEVVFESGEHLFYGNNQIILNNIKEYFENLSFIACNVSSLTKLVTMHIISFIKDTIGLLDFLFVHDIVGAIQTSILNLLTVFPWFYDDFRLEEI
jgi:hypothetical protein